MPNSGLTTRLRQQSRRTGLAVGFAMAGAIALCIVVFVVAYAGLDPLTGDFIAKSSPTPTATSGGSADTADNNSNARATEDNANDSNSDNNSAEPEPTKAPEPTSTPSEFTPDYLSNTDTVINFRAGPGTDNDVVTTLEAGTQLKSTGKEETDGEGTVWMEFEMRDGTKGWIRQIDAVPNN